MTSTVTEAHDTQFYNLHELEELAKRRLSRAAFDFYAGGAEDLASLRFAL